MLKQSQYWLLSAIGALCIVLVIVNMVLFSGNQRMQGQVNARAQYVQESVQLQNLYQQLVRALADLSVRNKDEQLSAMLAKQGIKVTANPAPAAASGAAATQESSSSDGTGQGKPQSRARRSGSHD